MGIDKHPKSGLDLAVMMLLDLLPELKRAQEREVALLEVVEAVAGMRVETEIFDQPLYALMSDDHETNGAWHLELIAKARALSTKNDGATHSSE